MLPESSDVVDPLSMEDLLAAVSCCSTGSSGLQDSDEKHPSGMEPSAVSRLMVEILIYIFDLAAGQPGIVWNANLLWSPDVCWKPFVYTAKSLALVCKAWHAPATEVLYRKAILTSTLNFPLLYRTLAVAPGNRGQLVRSLSIAFHTSRHSPAPNSLMHEYLDKILELCCNLKHLSFSEQALFSVYAPIIPQKPLSAQWDRLAQITHLRIDATREHSTLDRAQFLCACANLESLAVTWPASMAAPASEIITLPRLRALEVTGPSWGIEKRLSLPALQSLTFCFSGIRLGEPEGAAAYWRFRQNVFPLVEAYGCTLRRLHLNFLPDLPPSDRLELRHDLMRYQLKGTTSDQGLIELCPNLEHYITYTTDRLDLSRHHSLRWIDVWVPSFSREDLLEDPRPDILDGNVDLPRLESVRVFGGSLSAFPELPVIIAPDSRIPRDQAYATWSFGDVTLAQTRHGVTWLQQQDYDSDADSSYTYSSPSEEPPEEFMSDSDEGEVAREIQSRLTDFIDEEGGNLST
ncbi:hypothetical protein DENSPDRAFT_844205 [Dentipellis sp. KUC8613]|nr:hypothetical protein DENSPDRAFT_844205 [Dentipellis sp. KUC8613]